MRIAYINHSYPPMISGAALVVHELATQMSRLGHSVLVLAASDRGGMYTQEKDGLKVVRLRSLPNRLRVNQNFVLFSQNRMLAELQAFRPDVIHIHEPFFLGLPALLYGNKAGIPVIFTTHQLPWIAYAHLQNFSVLQRPAEQLLWVYGKWFLKRCSAIIAPSKTTAAYLEANTGRAASVISSSVDLELFKPEPDFAVEKESLCQRYGLDAELPVILYVGRLDVDKQVEIVIKAAVQVLRSVPAQVLIVGDGTQRPKLLKQAAESGFGTRFHFPGFITQDADLPGLYRLAAVFVNASVIETQGIVLLEAAASGLPVVAVRGTSVHEIVQHGVNGFLIRPGHPDLIAERVEWLLQHPYRAKEMGAAGRGIAALNSVDRTIELYETLCLAVARAASTPMSYSHSHSPG